MEPSQVKGYPSAISGKVLICLMGKLARVEYASSIGLWQDYQQDLSSKGSGVSAPDLLS